MAPSSSSPEATTLDQGKDTALPCTKKTGRPPNEAYMKLMRPDEDWRTVADGAERRKIQNRLAQRAYRRNLREKNKEVERLRHKLRKFEDGSSRSNSTSSSMSRRSSSRSARSGSRSSSSISHDITTFKTEFPMSLSSDVHCSTVPVDTVESDCSEDLTFPFHDFPPDLDEVETQGSPCMSELDHVVSSAGVLDPIPILSSVGKGAHTVAYGSLEPEVIPLHDVGSDSPAPFPSQYPPLSKDMIDPILTSIDEAALPLSSCPTQHQPSILPPAMEHSLSLPGTAWNLSELSTHTTVRPETSWAPDTNASLLHFAVAAGQIETLKMLLQYHPSLLHVQDTEGYTPLQRAVMLGHTDMVEFLLKFSQKCQWDTQRI